MKSTLFGEHTLTQTNQSDVYIFRAILKHMGLEHKMNHTQASKKWESLRKRFRVQSFKMTHTVTNFPFDLLPSHCLLRSYRKIQMGGK